MFMMVCRVDLCGRRSWTVPDTAHARSAVLALYDRIRGVSGASSKRGQVVSAEAKGQEKRLLC